MELSVIMPMYNSENVISNLEEATKALNKISKNYELILVDDGSTNNCLKEAKKFKDSKVLVVGYSKNMGKGNAIKYGFNFSKGDYIAFIDSGGDLDPSQLSLFLKTMKEKNADIVIGSKRHPKSIVHYPPIRRIMSKAYQLLNSILFDLDIKDTQVGIKLFRRAALEKIMPRIIVKKFAFDLEVLVLARKYNLKIIEAPIVMTYKFKSTINLKAVFWMLWDTAAVFYRLKLLRYYDTN